MVLNNSNFLEKIVQVYMRYRQQWRADVLFIAPVFCFSLLLVGSMFALEHRNSWHHKASLINKRTFGNDTVRTESRNFVSCSFSG